MTQSGQPRSEIMSKKVVRKAKLSFDLDEEDEENDDSFQVKKSKESKKFKKMRQAPGILDTEIIEDSGTLKFASAEIGGSYSAESLNQLKKAQLFIKQECPQDSAPPDTSMIEGVELSGEAAEEFVELTERLAMEKNANLGEYVSFGGGSADVDAIHAARLVNKTLLKGSTEKNDRIYTSTISKTDKRVAFDLTQDNDSDWEQEIIRRGVINTTALSKKNAQVTEKLLQRQSQGVMNSTANSTASISSTIGEITVADIVKSVQLAADKLEHNGASAKRKTEQIEVDISLAEAEEAKLRSNVEVGVKKLNIVQDMRYFFASLVGMLRDKSSNIKELVAAQSSSLKEHLELVKRHRTDEQEDWLFRIKESGLMISIGSYTPCGILSSSVTDNNNAKGKSAADPFASNSGAQVDEFGRIKAEVAAVDPTFSLPALKRREDRRLKDRVKLADLSDCLSATDRGHVVANQICDLSGVNEAFKDSMYRALDLQAVLYNSKGAEVDFAQKWETLRLAAVAVVDDVKPELLSVSTIIQKLLQFREAYPSEFQAAFIADSVTELLQPLIQLNLFSLTDAIFAVRSSCNQFGMSSEQYSAPDQEQQQAGTWAGMAFYPALKEFSDKVEPTEAAGSVGLGASGGGSSMGSMISMAARINNLFQEEEKEDSQASLLTQVADGTLLPWLQEQISSSFDPFSITQCQSLSTLMIEFKEICSTKVARDFQILLVADIERHFSEAALKICVPLLKNARSSNGCGDASAPAGAGAVGPETARAYILKQLWRVRVLLENAFLFRTRKLLKPDWAAKWAWQCLVEQCLPSALKLFKTGNLQDKTAVLDICTSVLSLITTVPLSRQPSSSGAPGSAASGFGNTVHDGQLGGWKIPPSQFRPLKAAVEKLVVAMRTLAQQNLLDGANSVENSDVCAGCGELLQALSSLA